NTRAHDRRRRAYASPTYEPIQSFFNSGIRFWNAVCILDNCFTVGKKSGNGESHRDSMIAKAGQSRAAQRRRPVNLEAIVELDDLHTHRAQVLRDRGNAIGFFDPQLVGVTNDGGAAGE